VSEPDASDHMHRTNTAGSFTCMYQNHSQTGSIFLNQIFYRPSTESCTYFLGTSLTNSVTHLISRLSWTVTRVKMDYTRLAVGHYYDASPSSGPTPLSSFCPFILDIEVCLHVYNRFTCYFNGLN
jgi:hypothetical protein